MVRASGEQEQVGEALHREEEKEHRIFLPRHTRPLQMHVTEGSESTENCSEMRDAKKKL